MSIKIDENKSGVLAIKPQKAAQPVEIAEEIRDMAEKTQKSRTAAKILKSHGFGGRENILSLEAQRKANKEIQSIKTALSRLKNGIAEGNGRLEIMNSLASNGFSVSKISLEIINAVISEIERKPSSQDEEKLFDFINDKISKIGELSDGETAQIIKSGKQLTIKNIYSGKFSGELPAAREDGLLWEDIKEELPFDSEGAEFLFKHDVPITAENIQKYEFLKDIKNNLNARELAKEAIYMPDKFVLDAPVMPDGAEIARKKLSVRYEDIIQKLSFIGAKNNETDDAKIIALKRQVAEIRLIMTKEAVLRLAQKGIAPDLLPVEQALKELKETENEKYKLNLSLMGAEQSSENLAEMGAVMEALPLIPRLGCNVYAAIVNKSIPFCLKAIKSENEPPAALREGVIQNLEKYSAVPNPKYGDSFSKIKYAFAPLLRGLGLPDDDRFVKAAGILSKNGMDINEENLLKTAAADEKLIGIYETLHPNIAAAIIRDGYSPSEMSIDEILAYIDKFNGAYGENIREKIPEFILELDKKGGLDTAERKKIMDIYKMLAKILKNDSAAIGVTLKHGLNPTMENLLNASRYFTKTRGIANFLDMFVTPSETDMLRHELNNASIIRFAKHSRPQNLAALTAEPYLDSNIYELADKLSKADTVKSPPPETEIQAELLQNLISEAESAGTAEFSLLLKNAVPISLSNIAFAKKYIKNEFFAFEDLNALLKDDDVYTEIYDTIKSSLDENSLKNTVSALKALNNRNDGEDIQKIDVALKSLDFMGKIRINGFYAPVFYNGRVKGLKLFALNENFRDNECVTAAVIIGNGRPVKAEIKLSRDSAEITYVSGTKLPEHITSKIIELLKKEPDNEA